MKGILEFNLPEENTEFRAASKATDLAIALFDINEVFFNDGLTEQQKLNQIKEIVNRFALEEILE